MGQQLRRHLGQLAVTCESGGGTCGVRPVRSPADKDQRTKSKATHAVAKLVETVRKLHTLVAPGFADRYSLQLIRNTNMVDHRVVSQDEWIEARKKLLVEEKELTRRSDELARRRQELPWVRI